MASTASIDSDKSTALVDTTPRSTLSVPGVTSQQRPPGKGPRFWLIIISILISLLLTGLDFTAISTALPTITHDLHAENFVWVGSAYALASSAVIPVTGGVAQIFGRRQTMLLSQGLFALGSALCGTAQNMSWLVAARALQGAGGGGLQAITQIIVSDLVPLRERPLYNALIGCIWGVASAIGPVISGSLAQHGQWRWLFYLNIPLTALSAIPVAVYLKMKTPAGSFQEKLRRMDWVGTFSIVASASAIVIALTWGGIKYPWLSAQVMAPLIAGLIGFVGFFVYEATYPKEPLVPLAIISNRTSVSGYIQNFVGPCVIVGALYFLPAYYQACRSASPIRSGVEVLGLMVPIGPITIIANAFIGATQRYRVPLWLSWILTVAALGAMSTLTADSSPVKSIGFPIILGIGSGIWYGATYFPILAPLPVQQSASALAFFAFGREFAGVWGVTIGTAVLQTQLAQRLPPEFVSTLAGGNDVALAYSLIPVIPTLDEPLRTQVQDVYGASIGVIWEVLIGVAGIGLLSSLFMKELSLPTQTAEEWGLEVGTLTPSDVGYENKLDSSEV